jgi:hypothetical protein
MNSGVQLFEPKSVPLFSKFETGGTSLRSPTPPPGPLKGGSPRAQPRNTALYNKEQQGFSVGVLRTGLPDFRSSQLPVFSGFQNILCAPLCLLRALCVRDFPGFPRTFALFLAPCFLSGKGMALIVRIPAVNVWIRCFFPGKNTARKTHTQHIKTSLLFEKPHESGWICKNSWIEFSVCSLFD